ncbi:hypothetical protein BDR03DRAFT_545175 [Suillus americanus]|nr:hypothetical protein BDR03DRAFT_545175 [Suillus americanus]
MAREHQPGRIGPNNLKQTNRPIPRGVDKGPAGYTIGLGSTSDTNFEHFNPLPTTGEREDVTRRRFASSAADTQDGRRREKQSIISTPEENAQASRHSNVTHRGSTAGADPYRVPPLSLTGKDRDRISALDQGRDRHKSYANLNITSSIPALSSSATYGPGYTAPINAPSVPAIIDAMKSVSFEDSGEQSNSSPKGWNDQPPPRNQSRSIVAFSIA